VKIKLDENLPTGFVDVLGAMGHDVDTVPDEGMAGQDDCFVWRAAQDAGRFLVTRTWTFRTPGPLHPARTTASC
jgi:predicted nuclease of predicted toxin-antitoxin system